MDSNGKAITQFNKVDDTVAVALGINELREDARYLGVSPNPAAGQAAAEINLRHAGNYTLAICDLSGRLIWKYMSSGVAGIQRIALPVERLCAGTYFITLSCDGLSAPPVCWVKE